MRDKRIGGVKLVNLPGGEHGYLVSGEAVRAASSAYYLVALRYGEPRLFRFVDSPRGETEFVASTDDPRVDGDQIKAAERLGTGSGMHFILSTWQIDPQSLTATLIAEKESFPVTGK